jgi:uncharacterized protein (DUF1778 family)
MAATTKTKTKDTRLSIRATAEEKRLVERAAEAKHVSYSQFVMQAALSSAEEILESQTRFMLPAEKMAAFVARLDQPARDIPALKKAAAKASTFRAR